jgi:hypothetical protein
MHTMDSPLFSIALILRAMSCKEPLGMRDAGRLLTRKSAGALRLGNTVHQPVASLLRRGYIVPCGERRHPRTGSVVRLYRRTDLGARVSLTYARTVRALYSVEGADEPPNTDGEDTDGMTLPPPVTSHALILEFLRTGNMSATQLARHYAHTAGSAMRDTRAKFQHGVSSLRRLGLIEEFYHGAQHILYNLTLAGERRAERYRKLVLMLYDGLPDRLIEIDADDGEGPVTERDPLPWFVESAMATEGARDVPRPRASRRRLVATTRDGRVIEYACALLGCTMARLADRLGARLSTLSRVLAGKRRLSDALMDGTHALILERIWDQSLGEQRDEGRAGSATTGEGMAPMAAGTRPELVMPIHRPPSAEVGSAAAARASPIGLASP